MQTTAQNDPAFGTMAVKLGHSTPARVQECVGIQAKMREMGVDEPLGEIMVKKGYLTADQHRAILKALGVHTSPIPGYSILAKVGQGGMGTVYKAEQTSVHRAVAVKVMSSLATQDKTFVVRFIKEAEAAGKLTHPNIISVIDAGETNGTYYFVMEFVDGRTTRELVQTRGRFSEPNAIDLAVQVARALEYIHKHKLIHRDIKPDNILLTADGTAKLGDFGLAKSTTGADQSLTQSGFAVGTPYTMSPEQVRGDKDVDIRADIYSLGATLYFWVTGNYVFQGKTSAETMAMHLKEPAPDPRRIAHISDSLAGVILKCLEKDRSRRYQTPTQLLEDMNKIQKGEVLRSSRIGPGLPGKATARRYARPVPRRTVVALPVGIVGAAAVAAVVILVASHGGSPSAGPTPVVSSPKEKPARQDEPSVKKTDDSDKLEVATRLYVQAEDHFEKNRWKEAMAAYQRLKKEFSGLDYVASKAVDIGEKISKCEVNLKERGREVERKRADVQAAMNESRWPDARKILQGLKDEGEDVTADLDRCALEQQADEAMKSLTVSIRDHEWKTAQSQAIVLRDKYGRTEVVRKWDDAITGFSRQADTELKAEKVYLTIETAQAKSDWKELSDALTHFLTTYHETETYKSHESEIRELKKTILTKDREAEEARAKAAWEEANRAYKARMGEKKYDEAREVLVGFEKAWNGTKEYASHASEISNLIEVIDRSRAAGRNAEAARLWDAAKTAFQKNQWEDAMHGCEDLLGRFPDTAAVKSNEADIKRIKGKCEEALGLGDWVLANYEFETDKPEWKLDGDIKPAPKWEFANEPHYGKRSTKLTFATADEGRWSSVTLHQFKGIDAKAEFVTFYAKTPKRGLTAKARLVVHEWFQGGYQYWSADITGITSEWKKFTVKLSEMKLDEGKGGSGKLERENVTQIGFGQLAKDAPAEFFVDTLRIESVRK